MTIKTCDCCGNKCKDLIQLQDKYKVDEIAEICDSCLKEINNQLDSITKTIVIVKHNFIRQFIQNLKKRFS